jgi:hypothetical protein
LDQRPQNALAKALGIDAHEEAQAVAANLRRQAAIGMAEAAAAPFLS